MDNSNIVWHGMNINRDSRAKRNKQMPSVVWFTGLSGSGKSTSANALEKALFNLGHSTYLLDGDNVRHGLCKDLGFSDKDRVENIRRVGEVANLMMDAGLIVLTSFISPFRADRNMVRSLVEPGHFVEVYVKASLSTCEKRDPKGLYKKARKGVIKNFTGIDSPYEEPLSPEIIIETEQQSVNDIVEQLIAELLALSVITNQ